MPQIVANSVAKLSAYVYVKQDMTEEQANKLRDRIVRLLKSNGIDVMSVDLQPR